MPSVLLRTLPALVIVSQYSPFQPRIQNSSPLVLALLYVYGAKTDCDCSDQLPELVGLLLFKIVLVPIAIAYEPLYIYLYMFLVKAPP